ncbi:MAG: sodium:proton antiporter NhaD [Sulfuricurvum sp.]
MHIENLAFHWIGVATLVIFVVGYYLIAQEERYHLDKAKPALFVGTFLFIAIAFYYAINGLDLDIVKNQVEGIILEIAEIFFFLFVAMTFIEAMSDMGVFDRLKYNLISKGYNYRQLFWITGFLAYFLSPFADNLTAALILSAALMAIEKNNKAFLVPAAVNIVIAANAGGVWSSFGNITTLMAWTAGKGQFYDFLFLIPASIASYLVTAFLLVRAVPEGKPTLEKETQEAPQMMYGAKMVIALGIFAIVSAVFSHQVLNLPATWGMLFGLSVLNIYLYDIKRRHKSNFNIFTSMSKIENNTLLFFFGILAAVGALHFIGWLAFVAQVYDPSILGATGANIGVGFISAVVDNVPVMSAVIKANPDMGLDQWMLVTLTAGIGGSLISFGSAAGVAVMGKMQGIYTFGAHMRYAWMILLGYIVGVGVWFVQYEVLGLYIKG